MANLPQHPDDIADPKRQSGYAFVRALRPTGRAHHAKVVKYMAQYQKITPHWNGPQRVAAIDAAWDYIRYVNKWPHVHTKRGSRGRPDFYKDSSGSLHVDLPSAGRAVTRSTLSKSSPERDLMQRMMSKVDAVLGPNDFAEAKGGTSRQQIVTAVGQLLLKHYETGKGRMFIVLPSKPDAEVCKFLRHHNITLISESA